MARSDFRFSFPKRVRFSEIDGQGVVFNARYLDYLDIAVTEYFRAIRPSGEPGGGLPLQFARTAINYRASIRLDEMIDLCVRCARIGTSSFTLAFEFHGAGADDLRCDGETIVVHLKDVGEGSAPLPPEVIARFEAFEQRGLRA